MLNHVMLSLLRVAVFVFLKCSQEDIRFDVPTYLDKLDGSENGRESAKTLRKRYDVDAIGTHAFQLKLQVQDEGGYEGHFIVSPAEYDKSRGKREYFINGALRLHGKGSKGKAAVIDTDLTAGDFGTVVSYRHTTRYV